MMVIINNPWHGKMQRRPGSRHTVPRKEDRKTSLKHPGRKEVAQLHLIERLAEASWVVASPRFPSRNAVVRYQELANEAGE